MKIWKKYPALLAVLLCLSLAACAGSGGREDPEEDIGNDWRVTGIVRDNGIITQGGVDTFVLVCINTISANFYLDEQVQTLYAFASYPAPLQVDPWEAFQSIDFADRNGDGNSDVAILFESDGQHTLMVWFWNPDTEAFVFQPEESQIAEGLVK